MERWKTTKRGSGGEKGVADNKTGKEVRKGWQTTERGREEENEAEFSLPNSLLVVMMIPLGITTLKLAHQTFRDRGCRA